MLTFFVWRVCVIALVLSFLTQKMNYLLGMLTRISLYRSPIIFNIIELPVGFQIEDNFMFGLKNNSFKH